MLCVDNHYNISYCKRFVWSAAYWTWFCAVSLTTLWLFSKCMMGNTSGTKSKTTATTKKIVHFKSSSTFCDRNKVAMQFSHLFPPYFDSLLPLLLAVFGYALFDVVFALHFSVMAVLEATASHHDMSSICNCRLAACRLSVRLLLLLHFHVLFYWCHLWCSHIVWLLCRIFQLLSTVGCLSRAL